MGKRIISIIFLSLLILSSTAFATNWIHVGRSVIAGEPVDDYVDSNSVVKNGDAITFWCLTVWEKPDMFIGAKFEIQKWEAKQTRQGRKLETYVYDANKKLIDSSKYIRTSFNSYDAAAPVGKNIDAAFKYAKEGNDTGQKPTLP